MSDNKYVAPPKPAEQVGGTHYSRLGIEPIQFIETNGLGYHEGNAVKYVSRWRNKNGIEDLNKAKWYIERLIELETNRLETENQTTLPFDEDMCLSEDVIKAVYKTSKPVHKTKVEEKEQVLFDACNWFNKNKGLVAYPVYDDINVPMGINVCIDEDETTFYTEGECQWYASQFRKGQ
jgi:hypothetical protein